MSDSETHTRRRLLQTLGVGGATALAGCDALRGSTDEQELPDGDWHSYGNAPENTNRVGGAVPAVESVTQLVPASWAYAPPVAVDGVVYFASQSSVGAFTPDGTERWTHRFDAEVFGAPAVDPERDRLYVPTRAVGETDDDSDRAAVAVRSLEDGSNLGRFGVGDERVYGVSVVDGDLFVRSATACVRFAPDGTERWRRSLSPLTYEEYRLGDSTAAQIPPAVTDDAVYVPDRDALVRLDRDSGTEQWRVPVDTPYAAAVADDDGVVQTGWQEVVAVAHDGTVRWRRDLHSRSAAAVADGDVYVVAGDLHELDRESGATNWQAHVPDEGTAAPVVADESVVVAGGDVRAFRRDREGLVKPDRKRWEFDDRNVFSYCSPVVAAGHLFVVGPTGLLALAPES